MTSTPPKSISVACACAYVQAVTAAVIGMVAGALAALALESDHRAAQSGTPNDLAGIGEVVGATTALAAFVAAALVAVPSLRLRRGSAGARYALIVTETAVALGVVRTAPLAVRNELGGAIWLGIAGLTAATLGALTRRSARRWTTPSA